MKKPFITKNKNGYWYIIYERNGKRTSKSTKEKSKGRAGNELIKFNPSLSRDIDLKTLEREAVKYGKQYCKVSMYQQYVTTWKTFIAFTQNIPLAQLTKDNIKDYIIHRQSCISKYGRPYSNSSINLDVAVLKRSLDIAVEREWILVNPAHKIKKLPVMNRVPDYKEHEIRLLLDRMAQMPVKDKYYATLIAFNCGLRREEVCSLKWSQIDMHEGKINLANKKDGEPEWVAFNDEIRAVLDSLRESRIKSLEGYVWGYKMSAHSLYHRVKKYVRALGLNPKLSFHSTRHTFVTACVNGFGIHVGQKMARHRDIKMTERYFHAEDEQIKKHAQAITIK